MRRLAVAVALGALATALTALVSADAEATAGVALKLPAEPGLLSPETRNWVHAMVPEGLSPFARVARILEALEHDERGPRVRYQEGYTGTAQEAFDQGVVNCLSFSQLVVAMAREVGVEAFYMDVRKFQSYTKDGDLVIAAGHMTAGFDRGPERVVLQFSVAPWVDYREAVRITDATARAYYHSNRGAETLQAGDLDLAVQWLRAAIELDPELPDSWVNLGVALRRRGAAEEAEKAYLTAMGLDADFSPAYQNLAALYRLRGDRDAAARLLAILESRRPTNPFVYLALGDLSLEQGDVGNARRFYIRGRRLRVSEPDLLAALGEAALALGKPKEAKRWLGKAQRREPDNARAKRLAQAVGSAS